MPDAPNVAYYNTKGRLDIESDNFTKGVSSCSLVPETPEASHVDIGGHNQELNGEPTYVLNITFAQDWKSAGSLSRKSIEWAGQVKTVTYTPDDGAPPITADVRFKPSQAGGDARTVPTATLALRVIGQPDFGTVTP